jgi:hypothetical protein
MRLTPHDQQLENIPYLVREVELQPERKPVVVGGSLFYNEGPLSMEIRGSYERSSNLPIQVADSGRIYLEYAEASKSALDVEGALRLTNVARLLYSGVFTSAHETGTTIQVPMIPAVNINGRGEITFPISFTAWGAIEYLSPRNIDRLGNRSLDNVFLLNAGGSTTIIPRIVLSAELLNIFNTSYEWWRGYVAPGIQFNINAKVHFQ